MRWWRFLDYWEQDEKNHVAEWYEAEDEDAQQAFDTIVAILEVTENWFTPGDAKMLTRVHGGADLCEILFEVERETVEPNGRKRKFREKYRPVGFISRYPQRNEKQELVPGEFVLLVGCKKSGRRYAPTNAFDLALDLKRQHDEGRGSVDDHFV